MIGYRPGGVCGYPGSGPVSKQNLSPAWAQEMPSKIRFLISWFRQLQKWILYDVFCLLSRRPKFSLKIFPVSAFKTLAFCLCFRPVSGGGPFVANFHLRSFAEPHFFQETRWFRFSKRQSKVASVTFGRGPFPVGRKGSKLGGGGAAPGGK